MKALAFSNCLTIYILSYHMLLVDGVRRTVLPMLGVLFFGTGGLSAI